MADAPARADAEQPFGAETEQFLDDDRYARRAHSGRLNAHWHALVRPGVAEKAAVAVHLAD